MQQTPNADMLKSQHSAGNPNTFNNPSSEQERKPIDSFKHHNSPFNVIGNPEIGFFVACGAYRLTELYRTKEECQDLIDNKDWEVISGYIGASIAANNELMGRTGSLNLPITPADNIVQENGTTIVEH